MIYVRARVECDARGCGASAELWVPSDELSGMLPDSARESWGSQPAPGVMVRRAFDSGLGLRHNRPLQFCSEHRRREEVKP